LIDRLANVKISAMPRVQKPSNNRNLMICFRDFHAGKIPSIQPKSGLRDAMSDTHWKRVATGSDLSSILIAGHFYPYASNAIPQKLEFIVRTAGSRNLSAWV